MALKYRVVGREIKGTVVTAYKAQCSNNQMRDLDKEQLAYLAATGQVVNIRARLTKDDVEFQGIGMNITDLPTVRMQSDEAREKQEQEAKKPMMLTLIGVLMEGRVLRGYYARSADGRKGAFSKQYIIDAADKGYVTNAIAVMRNGTKGLKGNGTNLQTLKVYQKGDKLD